MSKFITINHDGEIITHAHSTFAGYDTLCGCDGDDPHKHVNSSIVKNSRETKITCKQCKIIFLESMRFKTQDFD